ncbi:MAG: S1C family serine protease [Frankiaceae bacterium]
MPLPPRRRLSLTVFAVAGILVLASVVSGCSSNGSSVAAASASPTVSATSTVGPQLIPDIVRKVQPSVVTIKTSGGVGSGVIYQSDGVVITNAHVVSQARNVQVQYADGRTDNGTVAATDTVTDLAVVRVDRGNLPAASFNTDTPQVGSLTVVLGSPLGLTDSVTSGIVSGLNRNIPAGQDQQALVDLIQTDAPISPGNSGGAVVNAAGQVIGVTLAYIPPSAGAVALGFAIPSATVVDVVGQLLRGGKAQHAFLGIQPATLTPEIASQLGLSVQQGVLVYAVTAGTSAAQAGIRPGDVLTAMNGQPLTSTADLQAQLRQQSPGETVTLTVVRASQTLSIKVTLTDRR